MHQSIYAVCCMSVQTGPCVEWQEQWFHGLMHLKEKTHVIAEGLHVCKSGHLQPTLCKQLQAYQ